MKNIWQLQDAKNRFSQVIDEAIQHGPQTITRRGKKTVVILSVEDYQKTQRTAGSFVDFLLHSPLHGSKLDLKRQDDSGREIDL